MVAVLSCLAGSVGFRSLLPWPAARGVAIKRAWWEANKDSVDVVLLGSSRVARGYVSSIIEEQLAQAGRPLTVFNFGTIGMDAYESDHLLEWLLSTQPARLAWVVLEPESWRPERPAKIAHLAARDVYWRNSRLTRTALASISLTGAPWDVQLDSAEEQLARYAMRTLNIGAARWWLEQSLDPPHDKEDPTAEAVAQHRGWQPYDEEHGANFEATVAAWDELGLASPFGERLAKLTALKPRPSLLATTNVDAVIAQVEAVAAAGARAIHVIGPSVREKPWIAALDRAGHLSALINYQDPERYPELFDPHLRYDVDHMNLAGAERLSRLLGRDLARAMDRLEQEAP